MVELEDSESDSRSYISYLVKEFLETTVAQVGVQFLGKRARMIE